MKNQISLLLLMGLIGLGSCNPSISTKLKKSYPPLDYRQEVVVFELNEADPVNAEQLGVVKIGDSGFSTNCDYTMVLEKAKLEARKAGGNAIKIVEHKQPSGMGSSCHRITAKILKVEEIESYKLSNEEEFVPGVDYAVLNVYRYSGAGALVNYDLYLGDSVICRVKNNFKTSIQVSKKGLNTLWAKTEAKSEVPIDIKPGKTYYLRCGITMGFFVGHPSLELMDSKTGKSEFESLKPKN
jgi:hypothetical protein